MVDLLRKKPGKRVRVRKSKLSKAYWLSYHRLTLHHPTQWTDRARPYKPPFFLDTPKPTHSTQGLYNLCRISRLSSRTLPHLEPVPACPVQQAPGIFSLFLHYLEPLLACIRTVKPRTTQRVPTLCPLTVDRIVVPGRKHMAKKKKSQLKPVARGFATTSQPSKRALAEAQEAAAIAETEAAAAPTPGPTPDQAASVTPTGDPSAVTDSKELDSEEQAWQDMVDRWQNKTDREITRTVQVVYLLRFQPWY